MVVCGKVLVIALLIHVLFFSCVFFYIKGCCIKIAFTAIASVKDRIYFDKCFMSGCHSYHPHRLPGFDEHRPF